MSLEVDLTGQRGFPKAKMGESEQKTVWKEGLDKGQNTKLGNIFLHSWPMDRVSKMEG